MISVCENKSTVVSLLRNRRVLVHVAIHFVRFKTPLLNAFATNATGKLNVFGCDRDAFGVDSAQIGIFKKAHKITFGGFL